MKKIVIAIILIFILILSILGYKVMVTDNQEAELVEISSKAELEAIYDRDVIEFSIPSKLLTLPFSILYESSRSFTSSMGDVVINSSGITPDSYTGSSAADSITSTQSTKEYSTTNIQVENVDEADITKTDGDYIYSLSEDKVVITDVKDETQIKIASEIKPEDSNTIPSDLILYNNKLIVISEKMKYSSSYYYYYNNRNSTVVTVYDISDREQPKKIKDYQLEQPYYTSRCIDGRLYVISSGYLKEENDEIVTYYYEDGKQIDPGKTN